MSNNEFRIYTNDNCTGCNRCIAACTVPEANVAVMENGRNKIHIDLKNCINCGKCIEVCPHDARDYVDDTEEFLLALENGEAISALVAPSVRSNFPQYENLLGALRDIGCKTLFDTSFGADICTWGYIRHIQKHGVTGLISQPCPAVVNYIEKHDPGLIKALVPIQSPAVCTAIYMRKYLKIEGKIAFISPCIAKKDEFLDENTGDVIQYNVTFKKLAQALTARGIDYLQFPAGSFDNERHGMGAMFPTPGGLKQNVSRIIPDEWIYQVEGQPEVRDFLDEYLAVFKMHTDVPFLVDILNCGRGCNLGTGTDHCRRNALAADKVMYETLRDITEVKKTAWFRRTPEVKGTPLDAFDHKLKLDDFKRKYSSRYVEKTIVSPRQLDHAFQILKKETDEDRHIDCCSCGFARCDQMASAIARGINHPENCVEYHKVNLRRQQEEMQELMRQQERLSVILKEGVGTIFSELSDNTAKRNETNRQVERISSEVDAMKQISVRLNEMMTALSDQVNQYINMGTRVVDISFMSELLSINAAIQAARAGEQGTGFAAVADEMKTLSQQSGDSAREMIDNNERVFPLLDEIRTISDTLNKRASVISRSTNDILRAMEEINKSEKRITSAAAKLNNGSE